MAKLYRVWSFEVLSVRDLDQLELFVGWLLESWILDCVDMFRTACIESLVGQSLCLEYGSELIQRRLMINLETDTLTF